MAQARGWFGAIVLLVLTSAAAAGPLDKTDWTAGRATFYDGAGAGRSSIADAIIIDVEDTRANYSA